MGKEIGLGIPGQQEWTVKLLDYGGGSQNYMFAYSTDSTNSIQISGGCSLSTGTWYFFEVVRTGPTDTRLYINGAQIGSTYTTDYTVYPNAYPLYIGGNGYGAGFNGYMDVIIIEKS